MSNTTTLADPLTCAQTFYNALANGDIPALGNCIADDVTWRLSAGNNNTGAPLYSGRDAVLNEFLPTVLSNCNNYVATPGNYFVDGQVVCVVGAYNGIGANTGEPFNARFCHVLTIEDGQIVAFEQITDTAIVNRAIGQILN